MTTKAPALGDIARLVASTAAPHDLVGSCRIINEIIESAYGHELFTLFRVLDEEGEIERLYSSNVDAYPLQGRKKKQDTVWGRVVLDGGDVLISKDSDDLRRNFPDFDIIRRLGIGSMINIPVVWNGQVIGSANISHANANYFDDTDAERLKILVGIVAPVVAAYISGARALKQSA
ncbi:GAF domain-containing protein [Neorhizobium galegae]|uniref:GAF domain-containing protein n=1 Tax=Neorhizobium galegae TaxID=399 RepID=UPI001355B6C7|nr:GAF domain-containing protein [Neorhizobium galegae]KAB1115060.1 GAF domain-containing protein [Neorhizobium galegae]MCQ1774389.1 GAF domain-containing protein [Neorhizobium galegae]MCQ1798953.1 GAF domain-containing protein [Neorhizobium galegae]